MLFHFPRAIPRWLEFMQLEEQPGVFYILGLALFFVVFFCILVPFIIEFKHI